MNKTFSHLIWLGAGTASTPKNQLGTAEKITLIEARENACEILYKKHKNPNISIQKKLVGSGNNESFQEYNLSEYSSIESATGLKSIYPGLQEVETKNLPSTSIVEIIDALNLIGNNNSLIIDIPDQNLRFMSALQEGGKLNFFRKIQVQTSSDQLYNNSATTDDVIQFLENTGYILLNIDEHDPELPWLTFSENPLFRNLKELERNLTSELDEKHTIEKEFEKLKKHLEKQHNTNEEKTTHIKDLQKEIIAHEKTNEEFKENLKELQKENNENSKLVASLQESIEKAKKLSATQAEKISNLQTIIRKSSEKHEQFEEKYKAIQEELLKAEAQIEIIRDIFIRKENF